MDTTKTYIDDQRNTASINCPSCQKITEVSISALASKHHLKVKCSCKNIFLVEVEFRDKSRKQVDFTGFYEIIANWQEEKKARADIQWENIQADPEKPNCLVIDLSKGGIGFIVLDKQEINVGDFVLLSFRLDGNAKGKINRICQVKHINDNFVGGRMLEEETT
ncbi:MAG: PilZ domain-containing protein [Thermodesulfobacteriota bacterium]